MKFYKVAGFLLALAMITSIFPQMTALAEENLLVNGGFEAPAAIAGWTNNTGAAAETLIKTGSPPVGGGNQYLELKSGYIYQSVSEVKDNETYTGSFSYKSDTQNAGLVTVYSLPSMTTSLTESLPSGSGIWTNHSISFDLPSGATGFMLLIRVHPAYPGTVGYDNICINTPESMLLANLLGNSGFEEGGSSPDGWASSSAWGSRITWESSAVHNGLKSVKLANPGGYSDSSTYIYQDTEVSPGTKYQFSSWYNVGAGGVTSTGSAGYLTLRFIYYNSYGNQISSAFKGRYETSTGWQKLSENTTAPDTAVRLRLQVMWYSQSGFVYVDDLKLGVLEEAPKFVLDTDQVFYYTEWPEGTATMKLKDYYTPPAGAKTKFEIVDESGVIRTSEVTDFNGQASYTFLTSWLELKKEYKIRAYLLNSDSSPIEIKETYIYRYNRPKAITGDLRYMDGKTEYQPIVIYHAYTDDDFAQCAKIGTAVQGTMSSASTGHIAFLDRAQAKGLKVMVVLYNNMKPAGHPDNIAKTEEIVRGIKDHPAVYGYAVQDEPFLNDPENAAENLRVSYKIIRDIDDIHPVITTECFEQNHEISGKYCDILNIDPYPGSPSRVATYVGEQTASAVAAVKYKKPVYVLIQTEKLSSLDPTGDEVRNMIYQAFMNGAQSFGYFPFVNEADGPDLDDSERWESVVGFMEHENKIFYDHYTKKLSETYNKGKTSTYAWESWESQGSLYVAVRNLTATTVSASIPLTNSAGTAGYENCTASVVFGSDSGSIYCPDNMLDISMSSHQAILYKISGQNGPVVGSNILTNGDFETISGSAPQGWALTGAELLSESTNHYISMPAAGNAVANCYPAAGSNQLITVRYKSSQNDAALITANCLPSWKAPHIYLPSTNGQWKTASFIVPMTGTDNRIQLLLRNMKTTGVCYDDVFVGELAGISRSQNQILNPDFEFNFNDEGITNWSNGLLSSTESFKGSNSMLIKGGTAAEAEVILDACPKYAYKLSFAGKADGEGEISAVVTTHLQNTVKTQETYVLTDLTSQWKEYSFFFESEEEINKAVISFTSTGASDVYIDCVVLKDFQEDITYEYGNTLLANGSFETAVNSTPAGWSVVNAQLKNDSKGTDGANYVSVSKAGYVAATLTAGEGSVNLVKFDYKSVEDGAAMVTVYGLSSWLASTIYLPSTYGMWKTYYYVVPLIGTDDKVQVLLRNQKSSEVYYDNGAVYTLTGLSRENNLLINGDFECDLVPENSTNWSTAPYYKARTVHDDRYGGSGALVLEGLGAVTLQTTAWLDEGQKGYKFSFAAKTFSGLSATVNVAAYHTNTLRNDFSFDIDRLHDEEWQSKEYYLLVDDDVNKIIVTFTLPDGGKLYLDDIVLRSVSFTDFDVTIKDSNNEILTGFKNGENTLNVYAHGLSSGASMYAAVYKGGELFSILAAKGSYDGDGTLWTGKINIPESEYQLNIYFFEGLKPVYGKAVFDRGKTADDIGKVLTERF